MSQIERIEGKIRIICAQKNARWEPRDTRGVDVLSTVFPASLEPYGYLFDEHCLHLTMHSLRWDDERKHYEVLCDAAIAKGFKMPWYYPPMDLWKNWEAIKVRTLVLCGASSNLLSREMTPEMRCGGSAALP